MVARCGGEASSIAEFGDSSAWKDHGWSGWSNDGWDQIDPNQWNPWEGWNEWQNWDGRSRTDTDREVAKPSLKIRPPQPKRNRWGREASSSSNQVASKVATNSWDVLGVPKCGTTVS